VPMDVAAKSVRIIKVAVVAAGFDASAGPRPNASGMGWFIRGTVERRRKGRVRSRDRPAMC